MTKRISVPVEPTEEMLEAGCRALENARDQIMAAELSGRKHAVGRTKMRLRWAAMLAATDGESVSEEK